MCIIKMSIDKLLRVSKRPIETSLDDVDVVLNSFVVDKLVLQKSMIVDERVTLKLYFH